MSKIKIGIIISNRYHSCAGGKCFRASQNIEGAFSEYTDKEVETAAYTTCDGCPGGNIEYASDEMKKKGVTHIHFATGRIVVYPQCNHVEYFKKNIIEKYGIKVIINTHSIPQKYFLIHNKLKTWQSKFWQEAILPIITDEQTRLKYD